MQTVWERVQQSANRGLKAGAIFGAISLILNIITRGAAYERFGVGPVAMSAVYLGAGITGGAVVGFLRPRVKGNLSAAAVGTAAFLPMAFMIRYARYGISGWQTGEIIILFAVATLLGSIWGPAVWRASEKERQSEQST